MVGPDTPAQVGRPLACTLRNSTALSRPPGQWEEDQEEASLLDPLGTHPCSPVFFHLLLILHYLVLFYERCELFLIVFFPQNKAGYK